jgi:hypothetical protein
MLFVKSISNFRARAFLPLLFLFLNFSSMAQTTFNYRYQGMAQVVFESIHIVEAGYLAVGVGYDTTESLHLDMFSYLLNSEGTIQSIIHFGEINSELFATGNAVSEQLSQFVQTAYTLIDDTTRFRLCWLNSNGDTTSTQLYYSPNWQSQDDYSNYVLPKFSYLCENGDVYFTGSIGTSQTFNDAVLYKLDPQGHELWHYVHATLSDPDAIYAVVPHQGGVIYTLYHTASPDVAYGYHEIIKRDQDGDELWNRDSRDIEERIWYPQAMLLDNDSLVVCGASNTIDPVLFGVASIYKIDTLGNLVWSNTYGDYNDFEWRQFTNVVKTTDGNYVCGGTWTTIPGSEEIPEGQVNDDYDQFAHIVKFDRDNGDIIWEHNYRWLETYRDNHSLNDMKATPDGGVIFCGEANDLYHIYEPPYQQAWVVKLDACGCLVPGCDTECTVGVGEIGDSKIQKIQAFKFGPNPVSNLLNVYVGSIANADMHNTSIAIYDLNGKLMKSFAVKYANTTYMMDVEEMASGEYVMAFMNDGVVLQSEKLVVAK